MSEDLTNYADSVADHYWAASESGAPFGAICVECGGDIDECDCGRDYRKDQLMRHESCCARHAMELAQAEVATEVTT